MKNDFIIKGKKVKKAEAQACFHFAIAFG